MDEQQWEQVRNTDDRECWALLRSTPVGRLAVIMANTPEIFPVNHLVDHDTLLFRTGKGTKLAAVILHSVVAFEADGYDPNSGTAWSVVVKGHAEQVRNREELMEAMFLPLFPWHEGHKPYFVRIVPDRLSMRRFAVAVPSSWATPPPRAAVD